MIINTAFAELPEYCTENNGQVTCEILIIPYPNPHQNYSPEIAEIPKDAKVVFKNAGFNVHTATSTNASPEQNSYLAIKQVNGVFDSGKLLAGEISESITLDEVGVYHYLCVIHDAMRGTIMVTDSKEVEPTTQEPAPEPKPAPTPEPFITPTKKELPSPKKQVSQGIELEHIICKEGLALIIKHNGTPACVKPATADKLEALGWGVMPPPCCKPTDSTNSVLNSLFQEASKLHDFGAYGEAIALYDKALEIDPNHIDVLYRKGVAIYDSGKYREAIQVFDKAIEINPNYIDALYYKGHTLYDIGQYEDSIIYYDRILAIDPNHVATLNHKGYALYDLGRYAEAIPFYDRVLTIEPSNIDAIRNKSFAAEQLDMIDSFEECVAAGNPIMESYPRQCRTPDGKHFVESLE